MTTIEYCDLCKVKGIERPAYAIIRFHSVGSWFTVCRETFDNVRGEIGPGTGRLVNMDPVPGL